MKFKLQSVRLCVLYILMLVFISAEARTAADFFVTAPHSVVPYLSTNDRMDMLDYFRSNLPPKTTNSLGRSVSIDYESESLVRFLAGDSITMEVGVVARGRDTLLVVVETLPLSVPDSRVAIYDAKWRPYKKQPVLAPALSDWLTAEGHRRAAEVEDGIPFVTAIARFDPLSMSLVFTNTLSEYFAPRDTDAQALVALLKPSLTFTLNSGLLRVKK